MATSTEQQRVPSDAASSRAKLVYLYVASVGGATPADVAETLAMDTTTVLPVLRSLRDDGLLGKSGREYTCT